MASNGVRKWRGDEAQALIRAEIARRLKACCMVVARHAKELISVPGTGVRAKAGLTKGYQHRQGVKARKHARVLKKRKLRKSMQRKRAVARTLNKAASLWNKKLAKAAGRGKIKKRVRVTKKGTFTTRRKAKRNRP